MLITELVWLRIKRNCKMSFFFLLCYKMDTVMSIIDENKEKLSDDDYLKLCDAMRKIYEMKTGQTKIRTEFINRYIDRVVYKEHGRNDYTEMRNNNKRGILFSL